MTRCSLRWKKGRSRCARGWDLRSAMKVQRERCSDLQHSSRSRGRLASFHLFPAPFSESPFMECAVCLEPYSSLVS